MLKLLFGDLTRGRIGRVAFALSIVFLILVGTLVRGLLSDRLFGGHLRTPEELAVIGTFPLLLCGIVMLAVVAGTLNLVAKRGRDIGISGWLALIVFLTALLASIIIPGAFIDYAVFGLLIVMGAIPSAAAVRKPFA